MSTANVPWDQLGYESGMALGMVYYFSCGSKKNSLDGIIIIIINKKITIQLNWNILSGNLNKLVICCYDITK